MAQLVFRCLLVLGLAAYSGYFLTATMRQLGDDPGVIHYIHLVFHEAGHVLLCWMPRLLCVLGGTLGQLAVPAGLAVAFLLKNRDRFSAAICGWWVGQSLVDVAPYMNDARTTRLMLLGGGTGAEIEGHDWTYILEQLNMLNWDVRLAHDILATGRVVMVLALVLAVIFLVQDYRHARRPVPPYSKGCGC